MTTDRSATPAPASASASGPAQPRLRQAWHVACLSSALGAKPLQIHLFGDPIVIFRGVGGQVGALLDRCPHRNVPLSMGQVVDGTLACGYHGWRFSPAGACLHVPALIGEAGAEARRCAAFAVREQQGVIWIWGSADAAPTAEPFVFRLADDPRYSTLRRRVEAEGSVHAVAENALDVPHTAFLHGGLFRVDAQRTEIRCEITRTAESVACEYIGEPRPSGLVGRVLSPSGGTVVHFDRFHLPGIAEVEYQIGAENHILVQAALTPASDHHTVVHAVISVRARVPLFLVLPFAERVGYRIFGQDQAILREQTATLRHFGEARFVSTELDVLGPHILRLLRQAERGELGPERAQPTTRTVSMRV